MSMTQENQRVQTFSFTEGFIGRLTDWIIEKYVKKGQDLSRLAIVFGGKRPSLFLKREISRRLGKAYVSPHFLTIDEMIQEITLKHNDVRSLLDLDHSYVIYQLCREVAPQILKGRESFAQFLPWTIEILKFIGFNCLFNKR